MSRLQQLGWAIAAVATAAAVLLVRLPEPQSSFAIDQVLQVGSGVASDAIRLPYRSRPGRLQLERLQFVTEFELSSPPEDGLLLLIPTVTRPIAVTINGEPLVDGGARLLWSGPFTSAPVLLRLPEPLLVAGSNRISMSLEGGTYAMPVYLSKLFVGTEAELMADFRLRLLLGDRLANMALAAHVLLGLGIVFAYLSRPKDPVLRWLAAMVAASLTLSVGLFAGFSPAFREVMPFIASISTTLGFTSLGVALAVIGRPPPRPLGVAALAIPGAVLLATLGGIGPDRLVASAVSLPVLVVTFISATGVIAWGAMGANNVDARLLLAPFFVMCCFLLRDVAVALGWLDQALVLFTPYARPIVLGAVVLMLMRRLTTTLGQVDSANETLKRRLAEREAELAELHRAERIEAARQVCEQERERLTRDLHDGLSGHLVSIIAMAERAGGDAAPIEQMARQALDDLRLVIHSLDLGDTDLRPALATFFERVVPRFRGMGVELDWSMAELPDVSGVTPGKALSVLRIVQEAITNAVKHGPARKIMVRGAAASLDRAAITIENDGSVVASCGAGHGIENMRRRARQLGGSLELCTLGSGLRVTLLLPNNLPAIEDMAADVRRRR